MQAQPQTNGQARPTQNLPAKTDKRPQTVEALLVNEGFKKQIAAALPRHMTPDRMLRIALTEMRKNPELAKCDPMSFAGALVQAAQLGLEPGSGLGHAYLIPYWSSKRRCLEAQLITGYKGLVDLARRGDRVHGFQAFLVHRGDEFDYGVRNGVLTLDWRPTGERVFEKVDDYFDSITHAFAIASFKNGGTQFEVMSLPQILRVRDRAKKENPVWNSDFDEMARKTAARRLCKYLPLSPELARAIEIEEKMEYGGGQENWSIIDIDYEPAPQEHDPAKINEIRDASVEKPASPASDAARAAAIKMYEAQYVRVTQEGGDPTAVCRRTRETVLAADTGMISAAASVLRNWKAGGSPLRKPEPPPDVEEPPMPDSP